MKRTGIILGIVCSAMLSQAQQGAEKEVAKKAPVNKAQKRLNKINEEFGNLPKETRIKYLQQRQEAHRLFSKKRTFEALVLIYDMQSVYKNDPAVLNLLGAISVEFRDFKYAKAAFKEAIKLTGEDPKLLFNLAELEFCNNEWQPCLKALNYILDKLETTENKMKKKALAEGRAPSKISYLDSDFTKIMIFKQMLCHLALAQDDKVSKAKQKEHEQKAFEISTKFDYMVDSPFYYYTNAALEYHKGNKTEASIWIITAKKVFYNDTSLTSSWDDTLVEFGYIESHYGKHFKEDSVLEDSSNP